MPDIDFLAASKSGEEDKKDDRKKASDEDMQMHVPEALPEDDAGKDDAGFLADLQGGSVKKDAPSGDFLHPHEPEVRVTPPPPKAPVPVMRVPPPPPAPTPAPVPPPAPKPAPVPPPPPPKPPQKPETPPAHKEPAKQENGSTLRVSLLGSEAGSGLTNLTVRARFKTFIVVLILSVAVDALIYGGILFYKSRVIRNIQEIEAGVEDLDRKIADAEKAALPAQAFQEIARLGESLLERHLHWSHFLALLEARTLTDVQLLNLTGVETGTASANVVARDYTTLAKQILMYEADPSVSAAVMSGASAKYGDQGLLIGANSAFTIRFDPTLLASPEAEAQGSVSDVR